MDKKILYQGAEAIITLEKPDKKNDYNKSKLKNNSKTNKILQSEPNSESVNNSSESNFASELGWVGGQTNNERNCDQDKIIKKSRIKKSYRIPELDEKIRKLRTRSEAKNIERASKVINVPKIIKIDEQKKEIFMEFIEGKKLSEHLNELKNKNQVAEKIGESVAKLHDINIIHGDLTTSNMILSENKIFLIDFGLSFHSTKIEDKAVDIHLFKQALESKHYRYYDKLYKSFIEGYKKSKNSKETLKRLEKVEERGRYKH